MDTFDVKLLRRAIGQKKTHQSIKPLYGDRSWVEDLDIVNELGGHTGCVNALSWSSSGQFLASGSDDTYLNIWDYNPANLAKPFTLNTSVSTGHTNNIFSVKFMPHSNDRTVVTCAGDSEVRVFDLEYGGTNANSESSISNTRSRRFNSFFTNAKWLNEGSTNARVYRSHADRAKRIVTESSPHLFLSCSEDGEVRQWDLRQPSSAYPAPYGARRMRMRTAPTDEEARNVPPPLISYKNYALDLNTISCSGSQPHYIALGGAHLHCFLHDRRMLGRDISSEQGRPAETNLRPGTGADEGMREATRCVRRFAPNNKRKMGPHDTGHITACKISDARPNELIASWSGDHIYSFDIVKSPDARDADLRQDQAARSTRLRNNIDRKRKRTKASLASTDSAQGSTARRVQIVGDAREETGETALRVTSHSGDVELNVPDRNPTVDPSTTNDTLLSEAQRQSERVARSLVLLRKTLFDFSASMDLEETASMEYSSELTPHTAIFTAAVGQASTLLPQIEEVMRSWSYPVNPSEGEVLFQNTLRHNRQMGWRFVQAAGCLARTLGGKLQTLSAAPDPRLMHFDAIKPPPNDTKQISSTSRFCFEFLKAILLWLEGGQAAILRGFQRPERARYDNSGFSLDEEDTLDSMADKLCAHLMALADQEKPIIELGTNRFERDEYRSIFPSQPAAVQAFTRALAGIELQEHQGTSVVESRHDSVRRIMDKGAASRFWGLKVGRSLLLQAAEGVDFAMVHQAFGGSRIHVISELNNLGHAPHTISEEEEQVFSPSDLMREESSVTLAASTSGQDYDQEDSITDENDQENGSDEDGSDSDGDEDEGPTQHLFRRRVAYGRSRERSAVNVDVPYSSHTKVFKGHCNTRTVKDVNYYGLDDEYIVSGSDDGHLFIWDRKTGQIVNILEGDGEVVNVVQGHPYEPMIACSGIDSTVKIFGPGAPGRERHDAVSGHNIANPGASVHSSLHFGGRSRRAPGQNEDEAETEQDGHAKTDDDVEHEPVLARNGLKSRRALNKQYEITSQNDAMRREGNGDAFVTEGMLARLAAVLQQGGQIPGIVGEDGTVVVDQDNCSVM